MPTNRFEVFFKEYLCNAFLKECERIIHDDDEPYRKSTVFESSCEKEEVVHVSTCWENEKESEKLIFHENDRIPRTNFSNFNFDFPVCEPNIQEKELESIETTLQPSEFEQSVMTICEQLEVIHPFHSKIGQDFVSQALQNFKDNWKSIKHYSYPINWKEIKANKINIDGYEYRLKFLEKGSFGSIFIADLHPGKIAIKVQERKIGTDPRFVDGLWESYIICKVHERLENFHHNFIRTFGLLSYSNATISKLELPICSCSLLEVANEKKLLEPLIVYYTWKICQIVQELHRIGICHCDLKLDNLIVSVSQGEPMFTDFTSFLNSTLTLKLIDFGKSIDTFLFKGQENVELLVDPHELCMSFIDDVHQSDPILCYKHADVLSISSLAYSLLHGEYLKILKDKSGKWKPLLHPKRYWKKTWTFLFTSILNERTLEPDELLTSIIHSLQQCLDDWNDPKQKNAMQRLCLDHLNTLKRIRQDC